MTRFSTYILKTYSYSNGVRFSLLYRIILGILNVCLTLSFIYISKSLVDIATRVIEGSIITQSLILVGIILLKLLIASLNIWLQNMSKAEVSFKMRSHLFAAVMRSRWNGKNKFHTGDTINRMETDVDKIAKLICDDFPSFIITLFQLVAAFIFMSLMDLKLAIILLCITPAFLVFSKIFFRKMRKLTRDIRDTESQVQSHIQESFRHRSILMSLEKGNYMGTLLDSLQSKEYGQVKSRTKFGVFSRTVVGAAFSFGYLAAFLWGVVGLHTGAITFGVMTAFLQLVSQIQGPSLRLTSQIPAFVYVTASIDRILELEDVPMEDEGDSIMISSPAGVKIENIVFSYKNDLNSKEVDPLSEESELLEGGSRKIFDNFSFDFKPGGIYAVEGETGVGKSTMIRLILGLLKPESGHISIYDTKNNFVETSELTRCNFVYVPQGNTLFSGTIRENLLLGDEKATEEDMRYVLKVAAADFVFSLPRGLDTICGEGGDGLSEGQAQRIAIARGLLRPGSILLLDEFSSSLDVETEKRLISNFTTRLSSFADGESEVFADEEFSQKKFNKTMIFITHRKLISQYCDAVLTLS